MHGRRHGAASVAHLRRGKRDQRDWKIWLIPFGIAVVFVALMSVIYFGSVVDPAGHLHGLPVMVVNQDTGATAHGQKVDVGASLVSALQQSSDVTSRLKLRDTTLAEAEETMDRGGTYARG